MHLCSNSFKLHLFLISFICIFLLHVVRWLWIMIFFFLIRKNTENGCYNESTWLGQMLYECVLIRKCGMPNRYFYAHVLTCFNTWKLVHFKASYPKMSTQEVIHVYKQRVSSYEQCIKKCRWGSTAKRCLTMNAENLFWTKEFV